jgi:hypothetical protein
MQGAPGPAAVGLLDRATPTAALDAGVARHEALIYAMSDPLGDVCPASASGPSVGDW